MKLNITNITTIAVDIVVVNEETFLEQQKLAERNRKWREREKRKQDERKAASKLKKRARDSKGPATLELTFRRMKMALVPKLLLVRRNRRLPSRRQRKSLHISIFRLLHPTNHHHRDLRARRTHRPPKSKDPASSVPTIHTITSLNLFRTHLYCVRVPRDF